MSRTALSLLLTIQLAACSWLPFANKDSKSNNSDAASENNEPTVTVNVSGVDAAVADNIRAHVGVSRSRCSTPLKLLQRRSNKTVSEAIQALQAYGYYDADVDVTYQQTEDCPVAEISVVPNQRMRVTSVQIDIQGEASTDADFQQRLRNVPLQEGNELNHSDYSNTKSRIESTAAELGYLDGRFRHTELTIHMESYQAEAVIQYDSGKRYALGQVTVTQEPAVLREDLVHRLLEAPEGEPYQAGQVVAIQDRLSASGYFDKVEARPQISDPEDGAIPVDVQVSPSDRHYFAASLGFATDVGVRSSLGYTNRWWNDRGHRLGSELRLSQAEQGLSANYQIPREHPSDEWLRISAGLRQEDVDTFETQAANLTVNESKRRPWSIMENRFISLTREDFEVGNERSIGTFLIPGIRWSRRIVDNEIYPEKGLDLNLEIRGASETLISDTSFLRTNIHAHYLQTLPLEIRSFARVNLGAMWVDQFRSLPPSERFFAGGDNSIRGYAYQDLGPVNEFGEVIGGQYLGVVSVEVEKYLVGDWGAAVFVDTGNAFGGPGESTGLKTGAGIGLRWRSPVGPVRLDLAHPFDDEDTLVRFHLRVGPDL